MANISHIDKDIKEIFLHVKQIKAECKEPKLKKQDDMNTNKIIKDITGRIAGETSLEDILPEDVFEIVDQEETVSKMGLDALGICDICGQEIVFDKNPSGLVLFDKFFACERCCEDASNDELNSWTESKKAKPEDVKPIALWLMQEKNSTRLFGR